MFSFTIRNASGVSKTRTELTEDVADDLYFECIAKARKVVTQNDNVNGRGSICRYAQLLSGTTTYTVYVASS